MYQGMKSVVLIEVGESDEVTDRKMEQSRQDNPRFMSAVGDKALPNARETQEWLRRYA